MLAEKLTAVLVVAVHDITSTCRGFPADRGFLEQAISIPALGGPEALGRILDIRIAANVDGDPGTGAVLDGGAFDQLYRRYLAADGNIRCSLLLAHTALQAACDDDASMITTDHVAVALTRYTDTGDRGSGSQAGRSGRAGKTFTLRGRRPSGSDDAGEVG